MSTIIEIKKTALSLFAKKGYEGTALSEIADGVGIKKPSLYAHFNGKEDLFITVFEEVLDEYIHSIHMGLKELDSRIKAEEKLRRILFSHCRYYKHHKEQAALIKRAMLFPPSELADALSSKFLASEAAMNQLLKEIFEEGIKNGEIQEDSIADLLATYNCLIDGFFVQIFYNNEQDFEKKIMSAWRIYWKGISATGTK
ncbi:MAG: TetR/AcrR family transcriptional regulator [Tuberibacillus sp.]